MELFTLCSMTNLDANEMGRFTHLLDDEEVDINGINRQGFTSFFLLCLHHRSQDLYDCIQLLIDNHRYCICTKLPNASQALYNTVRTLLNISSGCYVTIPLQH